MMRRCLGVVVESFASSRRREGDPFNTKIHEEDQKRSWIFGTSMRGLTSPKTRIVLHCCLVLFMLLLSAEPINKVERFF